MYCVSTYIHTYFLALIQLTNQSATPIFGLALTMTTQNVVYIYVHYICLCYMYLYQNQKRETYDLAPQIRIMTEVLRI